MDSKHYYIIKPMSFTELCELYNMNYRTLKKHLAPHMHKIGTVIGNIYNVIQVRLIFEAIGPPEFRWEEN